jgi:alanyl-tRNA synthetase
MVSGAEAADMYTTYGFPPELFETLAAEHNLTFDWQGFRREMEAHGIESGGGKKVELFKSGPLDALKKAMHGTEFLGYTTMEAEGKVVGIIAQDALCDSIEEIGHADPIAVVLDRSPFYGESGGQVGDTGVLTAAGMEFEVIDTQREGNFILHKGHLRQGELKLGQTVAAQVDAARRQGIRRAHSVTHILHYALQKHLGKHAQQQGSKVDQDWLRFDFTHPEHVSREQLATIEQEVNERVTACEPVQWTTLPIAEARKAGAMMLFGEKYPDVVRMVSMGEFSKELCGGTHLDNTGQVGLFHIVSEESVAAGTRRITALTGRKSLEHAREVETALAATAAALKAPPLEVPDRVAALVKEVRELKKQLAAGSRAAGVSTEQLLADAVDINGVKVVVAEVPGANANTLREHIDLLRRKHSPLAALLAAREEGKVTLVAGITRDLQQKGIDAAKWINAAAPLIGGRGGGKPDMAQAGGKDAEKLPAALDEAKKAIQSMIA